MVVSVSPLNQATKIKRVCDELAPHKQTIIICVIPVFEITTKVRLTYVQPLRVPRFLCRPKRLRTHSKILLCGSLYFQVAGGIPVPSVYLHRKILQNNGKEVKTNCVFIRDQHSVIGCSV